MQLLIAAVSPLALFVSLSFLLMQRQKKEDRKRRPASRDRLLRPAGESLRVQIDELSEEIDDLILTLVFATIMPVVVWVAFSVLPESPIIRVIMVSVSLAGAFWVVRTIRAVTPLIDRRRRCRLGFEGERLVGQHLSELMFEGYRVFHDVPFEHFNVDHVVVGPAGVFAIETKTRRKLVGLKDNYKVRFDGSRLHWPDGRSDNFGIKNADDRARGLQQWLTRSVGVPVAVTPVLVYPGWRVDCEKLGKVRVLNPKNVKQYIESEARKREPLDEQHIRQITHQLSERVMLPDE